MTDWRDQLAQQLQQRQRDGLLRSLRAVDGCGRVVRRAGRDLAHFASNDYLALAGCGHLAAVVAESAKRHGVGSGASALIAGHGDTHAELEARFAKFKHAAAALLCPTGYTANLAAVTALGRPDDLVLMDKLCHASLIDAARLSGATVRVFPHLGYSKLERLLEGATAPRKLIVTDAVFSMDGDCADLPVLCELRDRFGAILLVDEAHATGVLGANGSGLAEHQGVAGHVDVTVSTASKALGSLGGVITAEQLVIDAVVNQARSFIYTTAAPPTQCAVIGAALDVVRNEPQRRTRLSELSLHLRAELIAAGWDVPLANAPTPIVPVITGDAGRTMHLADRLEQAGLLVAAVRPPTVAPNASRLRISLRSDHTDTDLSRLIEAIGKP